MGSSVLISHRRRVKCPFAGAAGGTGFADFGVRRKKSGFCCSFDARVKLRSFKARDGGLSVAVAVKYLLLHEHDAGNFCKQTFRMCFSDSYAHVYLLLFFSGNSSLRPNAFDILKCRIDTSVEVLVHLYRYLSFHAPDRFYLFILATRLLSTLHQPRDLVFYRFVIEPYVLLSAHGAQKTHISDRDNSSRPDLPFKSAICSLPNSYRAYTLGDTFSASRIIMGVCGLWCFIVG